MPSLKRTSSFIALLLAGCTTAGHNFCLQSGYPENSLAYKQCTARYQADRALYEYCTNQGITTEGNALNQCLADARQLYGNYVRHTQKCQEQANNKFSFLFNQAKREKQPTLQPNGMVTLDEVQVNLPYTQTEITSYTTPYVQSCLSAYGWNNPTAWQSGQHPVGPGTVQQTISRLNQQPILASIPVNPVANLFQAVSENNIGLVRHIINSKIPVDSQNYQGYTALHVAIKQGNFQMTHLLVDEFHANLNIYSARGENALAMAGQSHNPAMVQLINNLGYREAYRPHYDDNGYEIDDTYDDHNGYENRHLHDHEPKPKKHRKNNDKNNRRDQKTSYRTPPSSSHTVSNNPQNKASSSSANSAPSDTVNSRTSSTTPTVTATTPEISVPVAPTPPAAPPASTAPEVPAPVPAQEPAPVREVSAPAAPTPPPAPAPAEPKPEEKQPEKETVEGQ